MDAPDVETSAALEDDDFAQTARDTERITRTSNTSRSVKAKFHGSSFVVTPAQHLRRVFV